MATQAELQWIQANQETAMQLFGTLNPPNGAVGQFVKSWYDQNPQQPDAIDAPILQELAAGTQQPTASSGGGGGGGSLLPPENDPNFNLVDTNLPWDTPGQSPVTPMPSYQPPPSDAPGGGTPAGGTPANTTTPWSPLVNQGGTTTPTNFLQAPMPAGVGGNYQQVQNSVQGGEFQTTGQTNQTQQQTSGQTTDQTQTSQQGTTTSTSETVAPVDTLGFGQLLRDQANGIIETDATRAAWLQDVMNTGGSGFNSQVDQAVRRSLSGPQTTGAGDSARARMAGYAGAEVGRNNLNQRLAASEQLAGPTGLSTLSTAANPFIGTQSTGTGESLTQSLQQMANSSTGWQNLISQANESQAGTTNAQSSQAGAGNIPEGQPVKAGGCVLCTAAIELGLSKHHHVLRRVINHKLHKDWPRFRRAARGYFALFTPFARWLLGHPRLAKLLWPLAKGVVYEELRISGRHLPLRVGAWLTHWIGHGVCALVGYTPVRGYVTDPVILSIASRENINFNVRD